MRVVEAVWWSGTFIDDKSAQSRPDIGTSGKRQMDRAAIGDFQQAFPLRVGKQTLQHQIKLEPVLRRMRFRMVFHPHGNMVNRPRLSISIKPDRHNRARRQGRTKQIIGIGPSAKSAQFNRFIDQKCQSGRICPDLVKTNAGFLCDHFFRAGLTEGSWVIHFVLSGNRAPPSRGPAS
jgi:hypothetical protein